MLTGIYQRAIWKDMSAEALTRETAVSERWLHRLQFSGRKIVGLLRHVAQNAADSLTKKLFLAAYEASDNAYWRHHASQCEWRSLGGIIEYCPNVLAVRSKNETPDYLIAIRATAKAHLDRVAIKVKVRESGIIYEQEITQAHLCAIPVRKALTAIPLKPKSSQGSDRYKLGILYVKLAEAVDHNGTDLVKGRKIAQIFPSTGTDSAPLRHVEIWGQYWNTDAITLEKENIKARYYRELVQSAKNLGRPLMMRRLFFRLFSSHLGLTLTFWAENLWNAEGIRHSIAKARGYDQPIPRGEGGTVPAS